MNWKDKSLTCGVELQNEERLQTADAVVNGQTVTRNDSVGKRNENTASRSSSEAQECFQRKWNRRKRRKFERYQSNRWRSFYGDAYGGRTVERNAELSNQNGSNQDGTEEIRLSVMESNSQVEIVVSGSANLPKIDFNSNCLHSEVQGHLLRNRKWLSIRYR